MWYWIAMILLIAGSAALLAGSYIRIKKQNSEIPGRRAARRRADAAPAGFETARAQTARARSQPVKRF